MPNDWITIEENFVLLLVVYLPLIAPDFIATPHSKFNDGCMHLLFIKEGVTKAQLLNLMTMFETGQHLNSPHIEYVKVKAFRLEPLSNENAAQQREGVMMIDGERVPCAKVQAEIIPGLANVLNRPNFQ